MNPLCFVLMPTGSKADPVGVFVDFDAVYREVVEPAIRDAGLEPLRVGEEMNGGIIDQPMFERLILCEFAVADLTGANANVFYQLGIRHAMRPGTTVSVFSEAARLPFDAAELRAVPYRVDAAGRPANASDARRGIAAQLRLAQEQKPKDSPVAQLVEGIPDIARLSTDVFRERVEYSAHLKAKLAAARKAGLKQVREVETGMGALDKLESGVLIDLFLSYRATKGWTEMIALEGRMPPALRGAVMVREQLALALNRIGQGELAEQILMDLLERRGPTSETYGILGRICKDRWDAAFVKQEFFLASGLINKAIDAYLKGFEADWRDAYPGINALTLLEIKDPRDPRREKLISVVSYAVERRMATRKPDYWDHAARLELAVLAKDQITAIDALTNALAAAREIWELESTARNLSLIRRARLLRNDVMAWADQSERALLDRAKKWAD